MLSIGVIGYGGRAAGIVRALAEFNIPFRVAAVVDPRRDAILAGGDERVRDAEFFASVDDFTARAKVDGVLIGTRCNLHTDMAIAASRLNVPLFLEKPVAITFDQLKRLEAAFRDFRPPVVVSFPLRLTPIAQRARAMLASGLIGRIEHVVAFNDVPYGTVYFNRWYRDWSVMGGLFLQKATHDFDYIFHLLGDDRPRFIAAMKAQRVYGQKDVPVERTCNDCDEQEECLESPFNLYYRRFEADKVPPESNLQCLHSRDIRNEDLGNALIEMASGVQVSYTQNFFVRHNAARRGARFYGYKGTLEFDWYRNRIQVFGHLEPTTETVEYGGTVSHFGGDRELAHDFLMAMKRGAPSRSPIAAGITSALTCLWARESADTRQFCEVKMP